jgi:MFS family permease
VIARHFQTDNHLIGQQYALLGTILYVGITLGELPVNRLIQRFPVAKIMATLVFFWGIFVFLTAACHNWTGLMIVRFFLGLFEALVSS